MPFGGHAPRARAVSLSPLGRSASPLYHPKWPWRVELPFVFNTPVLRRPAALSLTLILAAFTILTPPAAARGDPWAPGGPCDVAAVGYTLDGCLSALDSEYEETYNDDPCDTSSYSYDYDDCEVANYGCVKSGKAGKVRAKMPSSRYDRISRRWPIYDYDSFNGSSFDSRTETYLVCLGKGKNRFYFKTMVVELTNWKVKYMRPRGWHVSSVYTY